MRRRGGSFGVLVLAVLLLCAEPSTASPGDITTVAGGGIGEGGSATAASIGYPVGVATDDDGNLYIGDALHKRVRKVDAAGVITTVAGNGSRGFSGDGGPATSASIGSPAALAFDDAGNLYISDLDNFRIRKIDTAGVITTFAGNGSAGFSGDGGPATSASMYGSWGLAVDSTGVVYVSDGNRVRKVDATGIITTVAGNGGYGFTGDGVPATTTRLDGPHGLAVDDVGDLYIADTYNDRIRKVDANGIITTVAGTGVISGAMGDGGPATSAVLFDPYGVAFDDAGVMYIADTLDGRVRTVDTAGIINSVDAQFSQPEGVRTDHAGNLYVSATNEKLVYKVTPSGGVTPVAGNGWVGFSGDGGTATNASLLSPAGVALDSSGNTYIADTFNNRVRKVSAAGVITTVAGNGVGTFTGDGGPAINATLSWPRGVAVDTAGNLYIADTGNDRVRKVNPAGIITTIAGNGFDPTDSSTYNGVPSLDVLSQPSGVAVDKAGNVYIADTANYRVLKRDAAGIITTVAGSGLPGFFGDGGPAVAARLSQVEGVAVDRFGNLYIGDTGNSRIRKVDFTGIISTVAGNGTFAYAGDGGAATSASLNRPSGVAVDRTGNIYIADTTNHCVRKVSTAGIITTVAGNGVYGFGGDGGPGTAAALDTPKGVAVDATSNVYIADGENGRIRKLSA